MTTELPFTPRLPPIRHQREFLSTGARRASFGLLWEQGTGKTKALVDNVALLAYEGAVDSAFVIAPNGVHRNWHVEELPKHWPAGVADLRSFSWDTGRAPGKAYQAEWAAFLGARASNHVKVLCMSYDALMTAAGAKASWDFLRRHRPLYIADESQHFKTPGAAVTKRIIASSVYAPYRRIASGTPMDKPFDIYSQLRFLDPDHWARSQAIGTYAAFKARFATWRQQKISGGREYPMLTGYRDLDVLHSSITDLTTRVEKADVLDLPDKVYKRVFHELTPSQRSVYDQLKAEMLAILDSGELVTAEMALVLDLRLSQVCCGFITPQAGAEPVPFAPNPREVVLRGVLEGLSGPALIWGRFVHDAEMVKRASRAVGRRCAVYDGNRPELSVDAFHRGEVDDLFANLGSTMTEGYTLNEADTSIYVSNSPRLIARQQSEDRNHRLGQTKSVTYIDILAEHTLEAKKLADLRAKRAHNGVVLGDNPERVAAWLREALEA